MPDITAIPTEVVRQILIEWCKKQFDWSEESIAEVVEATRENIYNEAKQDLLIEYKGFLSRVAAHPSLAGTETALEAKERLEVLEGEKLND